MKFEIIFLSIFLLASSPKLHASGKVDKINQLVEALSSDESFSGVVLVAEKGNIIYNQAFGLANREWGVQNTIDTKFKIGSVSKPFTAMLCLQLVNEGILDLNGTISNYLPEFKGEGADRITIEHLLTHTSGIRCSPKNEAVVERQSHNLSVFLNYLENEPLLFEPGEDFSYSNLGYNLLALIAERVSHVPFNKLLEQYIFRPLKLSETKEYDASIVEQNLASGYEYKLLDGFHNASWLDPSYAMGCGGLISTVYDLYCFDQALYSNKLIPDYIKEKMFSPSKAGNYGYGWEINIRKINMNDSVKVFSHSGSINGFGAYIARIENDSIFVAILKNNRPDTYISPAYTTQIGQTIISILYGENVDIPKKSIAKKLGLVIGKSGIEDAISEYYFLKEKEAELYNLEEAELNKLGIELYFRFKKPKEALKIFEVNMHEYPYSYNTYDSYAFILKETGDYSNAVKFYKKGLEILNKYPDKNTGESIQQESENAKKFIDSYLSGSE